MQAGGLPGWATRWVVWGEETPINTMHNLILERRGGAERHLPHLTLPIGFGGEMPWWTHPLCSASSLSPWPRPPVPTSPPCQGCALLGTELTLAAC